MAVTSSGQISFTNIKTEFGGGASIPLSSYYRGGSYVTQKPSINGNVPTSGAISLSNFYGTMKYTSGSASWMSVGQFAWTAPLWVETIYCSGSGGGAGGGAMADTGCIHDAGAAGGGSSGTMCANYALAVTPGASYTATVGGGGGDGGAGGPTGIGNLYLNGGNPGGSGGACSYFYNGNYYAAGSYTRGTGKYGADGQGPQGGYAATPVTDQYGQTYYYDRLYFIGGTGAIGYNNGGGGAGGRAWDWGGGQWGSGATQYGAGGGGGACTGINGGGYAGGGSGFQGFLSITW